MQSLSGTVGNAVPTVRTVLLVQCNSLTGIVDRNVKRFYEGHALLNILFSPGHIQHEITFLIRSDLRTIHIDDEIVVFNQMVDDRFIALASWKEQHQFLCYGLAHNGFSLITSGFIVVSFGRYAMGSASRKSPRLISSASR
ncbi:hypothetical protein ES703_83581 [subsurface metagenome]